MLPQPVGNWHAFENIVAGLYRALGVPVVKQNVDLAGNQIDIYVEERAHAGGLIRTAVECKFHSRPVPKDAILQFGIVANFLRQAGLVDKAVIVGYEGFTQAGSIAAAAAQIELVTFAELEDHVLGKVQGAPRPIGKYRMQMGPEISRIFTEAEQAPIPPAFPDTVFVAMPFSEELEDLYIYGIRKAVHERGLTCKRADEIEHSHSIVEEIIDQIKRCRIVVAEVSDRNPNVFYEVGWAHALERNTILVAREGSDLPFDVRHINTIIYKSIHQLEERLGTRIGGILSGS